MTTYRLPEGLSEVVAIPPSPLFLPIEVGGEPGLLVAVPNTTIRMIVPVSCLTEVPPPLPPVPDALAVAIGDHVFARDDDSHPVFICPGGGVCHKTMTWSELNDLAAKEGKPIVALRPDPADGDQELPDGTHLAYTIYHESHWWMDVPEHQRPNKGMPTVWVAASAKGQGGGVEWEFGVVQTEPGSLRLTMHDDAWPAFAQIPGFFLEFARRGNLMALGDVVVLLIQLGAVDETERPRAARDARRTQPEAS